MRLSFVLSVLLRPFMALALLAVATLVSRAIEHRLPARARAGRLWAYLTRPMYIVPRTAADRKDWRPVLWIFGPLLIFGFIIYRADPVGHHSAPPRDCSSLDADFAKMCQGVPVP